MNCVAMRKVRNKRLVWFCFCSSLFCDLRVKIWQFCPFVRCWNTINRWKSLHYKLWPLIAWQPSQPTSKRPVWIFGSFQWPVEQHFPRIISNKEDNLARIRKFSVPFNFAPAIYRIFGSSEWFAFRNFNSFRNLWKLFREIFVPFATVLFWLNRKRPRLPVQKDKRHVQDKTVEVYP